VLDLDKELRALRERPLRAPEPLHKIRDRARRRRRRRRRRGAALAVMAVAALTVVSVGLLVGREPPRTSVTATTPSGDLLAGLSPGWHRLGTVPAASVSPGAPSVNAGVAADQAVWTGHELVLWDSGGNAGQRFDPRTGKSQPTPTSPLAHRANVVMAWTGREVLVWGGYRAQPGQRYYINGNDLSGAGAVTPYTDGAAYNPTTHRWRRLPDAPIKPRLALGAVWTGREFIVSGGPPKTQGRSMTKRAVVRDGAAYDPRTNHWRRIPPAPIAVTEGVVRWTGHEMLVFGSLRTDFPAACTLSSPARSQCTIADARGALYDPATDRWNALPPSPVPGVGPTAAVADGQIVATAGVLNPQRYRIGTTTWETIKAGLGATPQEACYATLAGETDRAWLSDCGVSYWSFDTTTDSWTNVPGPTVPFDQQPWGEPLWSGNAFVYWQTNPWLPGTTTSDPTAKDLIVWAYVP
jgi:hypothetical protein